MLVKKGFLFPHPPLLIKEIGGKRLQEVSKTLKGIEKALEQLEGINFDTIVIFGPHTTISRRGISVLASRKVKGDFSNFGFPEVALSGECDEEFISRLVSKENKVQFNPLYETSLDHGIMLPLYFLQKIGIKGKLVITGIAWEGADYHIDFGKIISETARELNRNLLLVASGDLSHRLTYNAPAGYNPQGKLFDSMIVNFFETGDASRIKNLDWELLERAGECGYRPLMTLIGAFSDSPFKSKLYSYEGPFGVGYLVGGIEER
ncbi:MAG: 2-aminophenol 1,6-dioxygenase subunit beta [candidate division WS2 bacterium]|nr:2-aminophenol 1,6-dioxygenase subunit beta [Candidatus Lithacetigena glycinireducens]